MSNHLLYPKQFFFLGRPFHLGSKTRGSRWLTTLPPPQTLGSGTPGTQSPVVRPGDESLPPRRRGGHTGETNCSQAHPEGLGMHVCNEVHRSKTVRYVCLQGGGQDSPLCVPPRGGGLFASTPPPLIRLDCTFHQSLPNEGGIESVLQGLLLFLQSQAFSECVCVLSCQSPASTPGLKMETYLLSS